MCWFGIYDPAYSRNRVLMDGLRREGVVVLECNERTGGVLKYVRLVRQLRALRGKYDVLFCAFPVYINVLLAHWFQSKPVVADAFFSKYENVTAERASHSRWHPYAWLCYVADWLLCRLPEHLITDTNAHKSFWQSLGAAVPITVVPVGAHSEEFYVKAVERMSTNTLVQFHGSYIPLQGIDRIVSAVEQLQHRPDITFRFIGNGQLFPAIKAVVEAKDLPVTFVPWVSIAELNDLLNEADIVLGIFGNNKTDRVVPNKVFQGLAVRKPVITKRTAAIEEVFTDAELFLTKPDASDLADQIVYAVDRPDKAARVAAAGYQKMQDMFTEVQLGKNLHQILQTLQSGRT